MGEADKDGNYSGIRLKNVGDIHSGDCIKLLGSAKTFLGRVINFCIRKGEAQVRVNWFYDGM